MQHLVAGIVASAVVATGGAVVAGHRPDGVQKDGGAHVVALASGQASAAGARTAVRGREGRGVVLERVRSGDPGAGAVVPAGATRVEATVVSAGSGSLTFDANPVQLPAGLGVKTTGGEQVEAALPEASGAVVATAKEQAVGGAASGGIPALTAGEHVQVFILNGSVVAVLVPGAGD
jgi:hypothetical protein